MSKGFRFRLDAALTQRIRQEEALQLALANAMRKEVALQELLVQLRGQIAAAQQNTTPPGSSFDLERRMQQLLHVDRLARQVQNQQRVVQQQGQEVLQLRQRLIHASARRRALERLRERQKLDYDRALQQKQDRELDEQGTLRYARQGTERSGVDALVVDY